MSGVNKANARQSNRRKGYYNSLHDKVPLNKICTWARHCVRYKDRRSLDRLKQKPRIELSRAAAIARSPRVKALLKSLS